MQSVVGEAIIVRCSKEVAVNLIKEKKKKGKAEVTALIVNTNATTEVKMVFLLLMQP